MQAPTPRAGVRDAEDLEQLLDGAVLAVAAVQRDERDVGRELAQPGDEVVADVDAVDLVAEALQRVLDARARLQRDAALERAAALEDRDLLTGPSAASALAPLQLAATSASALGRRGSAGASRRRPAPAR